MKLPLRGCAVLAALCLSVPATALNVRSFISANGNDTNPCTRALPCRTLQVAHDKTVASGEINMLDPAGYGTVTITKSISILNDGVGSAGVLVPAGLDGITVSAGPTAVVNLRGLVVEGSGVGSSGIALVSAAALTIQNCVVRNMMNHGIALLPSTTSTVIVSDTYVTDNLQFGVVIQPTGSGSVKATFNRVEVYNSGNQLYAGFGVFSSLSTGTVRVAAIDSVSAHNAGSGFYVFQGSTGGVASLTLVRSKAMFNAKYGIYAQGPIARFTLTESTLTDNDFGPVAVFPDATGTSYRDNNLDGFPDLITIPKT